MTSAPINLATRGNGHLHFFFLLGLLLVSLDILNINIGVRLKVAHPAFVFFPAIFAVFYGTNVNRTNLIVGSIFVLSLIPSVLLSTDLKVSAAFLVGAVMCVAIMMTFARMSYLLQGRTILLMIWFYRLSVIITLVLVLSGLQERGHFLFYEPSYWAIALIPYFCIVFHRHFQFGLKHSKVDIAYVILAILLSTSVSMVLWASAAFLALYFTSGQYKKRHLVGGGIALCGFITVAYHVHERTRLIIEGIVRLVEDPSTAINLLLFVAGNRSQRVLVAFEAFVAHPFFGVGPGALRGFAAENFSTEDFEIAGKSATDFVAEMNATNAFLELGAEGGLLALIGIFVVLIFIHRKRSNPELIKPLKVAFYLTMAVLLIESSYLRTYVWALYGIIIGLSSVRNDDFKHVFIAQNKSV